MGKLTQAIIVRNSSVGCRPVLPQCGTGKVGMGLERPVLPRSGTGWAEGDALAPRHRMSGGAGSLTYWRMPRNGYRGQARHRDVGAGGRPCPLTQTPAAGQSPRALDPTGCRGNWKSVTEGDIKLDKALFSPGKNPYPCIALYRIKPTWSMSENYEGAVFEEMAEWSRMWDVKPSGRRVFCPWPALARSLQPAAGMLRSRRLGPAKIPRRSAVRNFQTGSLRFCLKVRSSNRLERRASISGGAWKMTRISKRICTRLSQRGGAQCGSDVKISG